MDDNISRLSNRILEAGTHHWCGISSTFAVLPPTDFTSTVLSPIYIDLNFTSTFMAKLYFDLFFTTLLRLFCRKFSSTFLSQLYFDRFVTTLLRSKLYFDLFVTTLLRPILRPKLHFELSKDFEVQWALIRTGQKWLVHFFYFVARPIFPQQNFVARPVLPKMFLGATQNDCLLFVAL